MLKIDLVPVDETNHQACLNLEISPEQEHFVPDIASSLEMARKYDQARPLAILYDGEIVGFCLYGVDEASGQWKIYRLLIGAQWQRMGIGRQAMLALIKRLHEQHGAESVLLVYHRENEAAERLYNSLGFVVYQLREPHKLAKLMITEEMLYDPVD